MSTSTALLSEDDVRTKVVYAWLAGAGINPSDISVEYSFEIKLGRSAYRIGSPTKPSAGTPGGVLVDGATNRPRTDLLVRHCGKNLLILEIKGPEEPLDDEARTQGISYARLLPQMAPFVVLTNGRETKIFDTITGKQIDGESIPSNHPTVRAGFRLGCDDLRLRAEALDLFVSLSPQNLLLFCERQVKHRMNRLRDEDPATGKKYIPSLYVERPRSRDRLLDLLDRRRERVIAIVGRPQVGKTNFLCHRIERRLAEGHPCLFYPALSLEGGLLQEIAEDFGWILGDAATSPALVVGRLTQVLHRAGARLTLFIDGWNEADVQVAHAIDRECEKLSSEEIQIVLSFTHSAARRLLVQCGNPSFVAEKTLISKGGAGLIEADPEASFTRSGWSVVAVESFDREEQAAAYGAYARHYQVRLPATHQPTGDPYLLAVAMRRYAGGSLPDVLDEPELLESWLCDRIARVVRQEELDVPAALAEFGCEMIECGSPVPESAAKRRWGIAPVRPVPHALFDAALLAPFGGSPSGRFVDFYNSRDRDFVIACWSARWQERLAQGSPCWAAFAAAARTNAGADSLAWFLRQPRFLNSLLGEDGGLPDIEDARVRQLLLAAVGHLARRSAWALARARRSKSDAAEDAALPQPLRAALAAPDRWMGQARALAEDDPDALVRIEALRLFVGLIDEDNPLVDLLPEDDSLHDLVLGILEVHEDYPLLPGEPGQVVLDAFLKLHAQESRGDDAESTIVTILEAATRHESETVREAAHSCWGHVAPVLYLSRLLRDVQGYCVPKEALVGVGNAVSSIADTYYGPGMCPGYLHSLEGDSPSIIREYLHLRGLAQSLCALRNVGEEVRDLNRLLDRLLGMLRPDEREQMSSPPPSPDAPGQRYLFD